jgi:hypothetical protein
MKRLFLILVAVAGALSALAQPSTYYVAGDFQAWSAGVTPMTQISPGVWQLSLTGVPGRHEFKITGTDWTWNYPGPNSWFYAPASGNITITYDVNSHADGWLSTSQRIGLNADPGTWTAAGDFEGWNNAAGNMTALGGGIYEYDTVLTPGQHSWKAVVTGTWDSISLDNRSVGTSDFGFTVTPDAPLARFQVDALNGTVKLDMVAVPEPSSFALLGLGLAVARFGWRRR